jgi:hypothetical protein
VRSAAWHDYDMLFLGLADGLFTGYFSKGR